MSIKVLCKKNLKKNGQKTGKTEQFLGKKIKKDLLSLNLDITCHLNILRNIKTTKNSWGPLLQLNTRPALPVYAVSKDKSQQKNAWTS